MGTQSDAVRNPAEPPSNSQEASQENTQAKTQEDEIQARITKAVREATGKQGKEHKLILDTITKERDELKTRASTAESKIQSIEDERKSLREQIEDLTSGDPEKFNLIKKERELRDKEAKYKVDLQAWETEKQSYNERISRTEEREKAMTIFDVAAEYENPQPDMLSDKVKELEGKLGVKITTEEQIRSVAEILWGESGDNKPPENKEPMKTYSGTTEGGGKESLEDLMEQAKNLKGKSPAEIAELQKKISEARKLIRT